MVKQQIVPNKKLRHTIQMTNVSPIYILTNGELYYWSFVLYDVIFYWKQFFALLWLDSCIQSNF